MSNINLSKSKYCRAKQCDKILWLDKNKPDVAVQTTSDSIFKTGIKVGELAKKYFGEFINIEYNHGDLSRMIVETEAYLQNVPNVITEASFNYKNNFCSVDILKNDIDGLEIYEVKSTTEVKDINLDDVAYQVYVLNGLGYKIKSVNIMFLNDKYLRQGKLDLNQLFNIQDVTNVAFSKQEEIQRKILEINEYMQCQEEPNRKIGMQCFKPYPCAYWNYCTRNLPKKNVFSISGMMTKKKLELYNKGIFRYEDLINENINENYKQEVEVELTDEIIIKKDEIREFVKTLYYPLYFLDFETFQHAIPEYDGTRPYQQIPFQYSLHYIERENGELKHTEFLAEVGKDPRRSLAENLVRDIPTNVCVTAYNMSFEKRVIEELAEQFEDLRDNLLKIHNNIKDLMIPFQKRWYYIKEMEGSYSIKFVLPALYPNNPECDYNNLLIVHNGEEASNIYESLQDRNKEEQDKIRKALLEYCKLDTLAMVKVWEKLKEKGE